MNGPLLKKPKKMAGEMDVYGGDIDLMRKHEEALKSLVENRIIEVGHLKDLNISNKSQFEYWRSRFTESSSMLDDAEERLRDASSKLALLQSALVRVDSKPLPAASRAASSRVIQIEPSNPVAAAARVDASSAVLACPTPNPSPPLSRPRLFIPAAPKIQASSSPPPSTKRNTGNFSPLIKCPSVKMEARTSPRPPVHLDSSNKHNQANVLVQRDGESYGMISKRNLGQLTERRELISEVRSLSSVNPLRFGSNTYIPGGHRRKLRCLALNHINKHQFITSALDGVVSIWKLQDQGETASVIGTRDCLSPLKKWPEDVTWHPDGEAIFAAYSADGADSQISILKGDLSPAIFLEEKPHEKGMINNITFMPWEELCFGTAGSDHAVVLWTARKGSWIPKAIHRSEHTSAVMGVYGVQHKTMIVSAGVDKRLIGFDLTSGISEFKHLIDSKCMAVLPNPCDLNLLLVQTGAHERQLRLFDIRTMQREIHSLGFKQESSGSHSAQIKPSWSPDGLHISCGSVDPIIHLFDIRYTAPGPVQSLRAHQKRVFKAEWHQSFPLLVSISSDLHIGLNRIT